MKQSARIPRKLKKKLKKRGLYKGTDGVVRCIVCQKKIACCGYNLLFCKKCWSRTY